MDPKYHVIIYLYKIIIQLFRSYFAPAAIFIKPLLDISDLVKNLHIFNANYESLYKQIKERPLDKNEDDKLYPTDCQYRRDKLKH